MCVCVLHLKLHIGDGLTHLSMQAAGPMREKEQNSPGDTNVATQITRRRRALAGSRQDLANVRGRDGEIGREERTPTPSDVATQAIRSIKRPRLIYGCARKEPINHRLR